MDQIKVVQIGLGPIGIECARLVLSKATLKLVGGVDNNPDLIGRKLSEVLKTDRPLAETVSEDIKQVLEQTNADVVLLCTSSFLTTVEPQLKTCIESGVSVVSSSEELFHPFRRDAEWSSRIDRLAKEYGVTVTGTGVNPGFSLDILPLTMSSVCAEIQSIDALRISDAGKRRLPLQKKVGAGLTPEDFRNRADAGKIGHIGLVESLHSIADALGFPLDRVQETIDPKIAEQPVITQFLSVKAGEVAGIIQRVTSAENGIERIKLELQMYVGATDELDSVRIDGNPPVDLRVAGGIFGDQATVARMVNAVPVVRAARPGLLTAADLPLPCMIR